MFQSYLLIFFSPFIGPPVFFQLFTLPSSDELHGIELTRKALFLDSPSHLYKRVCPSVGSSVRGSVRPWVCPSMGPSVLGSISIKENCGILCARRILCRVSGLFSFSFWPDFKNMGEYIINGKSCGNCSLNDIINKLCAPVMLKAFKSNNNLLSFKINLK